MLSYLFPFQRLHLKTHLPAPEVRARLAAVTAPSAPRLRRPAETVFIGEILGGRFRLAPIIRGRSAYRPWLLGEITGLPSGGSSIRVTATLHPVAFVVMTVGCSIALRYWMAAPGVPWLPLGLLLIIHLAMCAFGFVPEVAKCERKLAELLVEKSWLAAFSQVPPCASSRNRTLHIDPNVTQIGVE